MNLANLLQNHVRVLLVGPPGTAKTARILQAAKASHFRPVIWRASLMERVDIAGCIVPDRASGISVQLPFSDVKMLKETKENILLFLDDLGQAPLDVQAALMRLFDSGEISTSVVIWAATNRPGDKAGVSALCEPLRSRFHVAFSIPTPGNSEGKGTMIGTWDDEAEGWLEWASMNGAPAEVIAWHKSTSGSRLYDWQPSADPSLRMADFRSWETVIRLWNAGLRSQDMISAAIGKAGAAEFLAFASLAVDLPSPDEIWANPSKAPVPQEMSAKWLMACTLSMALKESVAPQFMTYIPRLGRVIAAYGARQAFRFHAPFLSKCKEWNSYFTANKELFATR